MIIVLLRYLKPNANWHSISLSLLFQEPFLKSILSLTLVSNSWIKLTNSSLSQVSILLHNNKHNSLYNTYTISLTRTWSHIYIYKTYIVIVWVTLTFRLFKTKHHLAYILSSHLSWNLLNLFLSKCRFKTSSHASHFLISPLLHLLDQS